MAEFLLDWKRSAMCAEFSEADIGKTVIVMGWVAKYRNLGNLFFADLRDRSGIIQIAVDDSCPKEAFEAAASLRNEYVVAVRGSVRSRGGNVNANIPTGAIEVLVEEIRVLSKAEVTPFAIAEECNANEQLRLKYRYLDLRRSKLQQYLILRDKITHIARQYLSANGFMDIETPFLGKSTPEGARDYLVPSRIHEGCFYALPQSPQLYKQLLMISGMDRYYQVARCFRDEDLRADRQPEFTQIDIEMSFVENERDVMDVSEGLIKAIYKECKGIELEPFKCITYSEAMAKYGSDKPYTHFGMEIADISDAVKSTEFVPFKAAIDNGGKVKAIVVKGTSDKFTRKRLDYYGDYAKSCGAKGMAYAALKTDGNTGFASKLSADEFNAICTKLNAVQGDVILVVADKENLALTTLGKIRVMVAQEFNFIDEKLVDVLWVVDFPLMEYSEEEGRFVSMHHPFTSPKTEDLPLLDTDLGAVRAKAYDCVINGQEAGGGSIRIYKSEVQRKMFELLGLSEYDIKVRFGYFVEAFKYGTPPHGGLAFGLDRLVMLISGTNNIKDVIAFPKVQNASCLMSEAPTPVSDKQLDELYLSIKH